MRLLLIAVLLAGCASGPTTYTRLRWAKIELDQAKAECYAETSWRGGPNFYECMRAKGWEEH